MKELTSPWIDLALDYLIQDGAYHTKCLIEELKFKIKTFKP